MILDTAIAKPTVAPRVRDALDGPQVGGLAESAEFACAGHRGALEPLRGPSRPILMSVRLALAVALALWALVGCSDAQGVDRSPHPEVTAADAAVGHVGEAEADLILYVSNQSFDNEEVRLTVTIDGVTVVDSDFHVEGQHNWVSFPLALSSGRHEVTAESDSGARLRESFDVRRGKTRYAVIEHWTQDGAADLTWQFQRQAIGFA